MIADKGFDQKFGARPLNRAIQKFIEDPLAEEIIKNSVSKDDNIIIALNKSNDDIEIKTKKKRKPKKKEEDESKEDK